MRRKHHARGNGYLGVHDVLPHQLFAQLASDQRVVFRRAQEGSDPFESFDEIR